MTPRGGGEPAGPLRDLVLDTFGSLGDFRAQFVERATTLFGSGYVWLSFDPANGRLAIEGMKDAGNPMTVERVPVLGMDVWEHAYYLDYQNRRDRYASDFLSHLANWDFASANLEKVR